MSRENAVKAPKAAVLETATAGAAGKGEGKPETAARAKAGGAKAAKAITEAELRKAPVSEYMSQPQLDFFRGRLIEMQKELLEKADVTSEHLREHEVEPDPTDQATIEEEYALELRARDRERKLLKKIDESLRRIEDGSYGWCEETGEPIGIPRLLARPTATLTIEAQARRELKQKMYGD
jgi:DnaK suppressor protein